MKKIIILLSTFSNPHKNPVAASLAWMADARGFEFDVYYDAFRLGDHFGGGALDRALPGRSFGSTATGHSHTDAFHRLLCTHECHFGLMGGSYFVPWIESLDLSLIVSSEDPLQVLEKTAGFLDLEIPRKLHICGGSKGEDTYIFPLILQDKSAAVHYSKDLRSTDLGPFGRADIEAVLCSDSEITSLASRGIKATRNSEFAAGNMTALSEKLSGAFADRHKGYFLGDPVVTSYFLPFIIKNQKLALYSEPLNKIINVRTMPGIPENPVIYGRMYSDDDSLEISRLGGCWQLVDPGRPSFPAAAIPIEWPGASFDMFDQIDEQTSDEKLEEHARRGDILTSLVFWSGCVREIENFHRLFEILSVTGFKCGAAVTSKTFSQGASTPFGLLTLPVQRGGVFPLVEPLLASSGLGFSLESFLPAGAFRSHLEQSLEELARTAPKNMRPRGWWACLDTGFDENPSPEKTIRDRPFGRFKPGKANNDIRRVLSEKGFAYALSKQSGINEPGDGGGTFMLGQTAGKWRGWSPFIDVESIADIKRAEKELFIGGGPGCLIGTIDSCLWTFSLPHWEKGRELKEMIDFIMRGGRSKRLINAHPYAVYRYARFLAARGYAKPRPALGRAARACRWLAVRGGQAAGKIFFKS